MKLPRFRRFADRIIPLLLILYSPALYCQTDYKIERITSEDGLAHDFVYCVLQDTKGFMWFGTGDGLNKYDGRIIRTYRHDPSDSTTLLFSSVTSLAEDSAGYIWTGSAYGLNRLDRYTGKVRRYSIHANKQQLLGEAEFPRILIDKTGVMWVGTVSGLYRFVPALDMFVQCTRKSGTKTEVPDTEILAIAESDNGDLWIGTANTLFRYCREDDSFDAFNLPKISHDGSQRSQIFGSLLRAESESVFPLPVLNYLLSLEWEDGIVLPLNHLPASQWRKVRNLRCSFAEQAGNKPRWMIVDRQQGEYSGLYRIWGKDGSPLAVPEIMARGTISSWQLGRDGILWLGTEQGVCKVKPELKPFTNYTHDPGNPGSLGHSRIRCIHQDQRGDVWVGTDGGLDRLSDSAGAWRHLQLSTGRDDTYFSAIVNTISEESDGKLLLGTNYGIKVYHPETDGFSNDFGLPEHGDCPLRVWSFCRDREKYLWVGSGSSGLWQYGRDGRLLRRFQVDKDDSLGLCDNNVWVLYQDSRGTLWIGTRNGLNRWLPGKGAFRQYRHSKGDTTSICGNDIWWIYEDENGRLWIAAYGFGLSRYDYETDSFQTFNTVTGLKSNGVFGVLSDSRGKLWIPSNEGLSLYDPETGTLLNTYDRGDGLPGKVFAYKAMFKAPDGELFFGGLRGLTRFYPEQIRRNNQPPSVFIRSFRIFDSTARHELSGKDTLRLNYDQNFISFEFSVSDYHNSDKTTCVYMLQGVDADWVYPRDRRSAAYTNLEPGSYVLRVRGANSDGVWNTREARAYVEILPPYWQTWWFRTISVLLILMLLFGGITLRFRSIRRAHRLERHALEAELQALRAQLNPHFIFNSLTLLHTLLQNESQTSATEYLAGVANLFRRVLEHSRFPLITVEDELCFLRQYLALEASRFGSRIRYRIRHDPDLNVKTVMIPPMLLQPFVENAIVHGLLPKPEGGELKISIRHTKDQLLCTVEDNGVGREHARRQKMKTIRHRSMGIDLGRKHLDILSRQGACRTSANYTDLYDRHGNACGTRVDLCIGLQESVTVVQQ